MQGHRGIVSMPFLFVNLANLLFENSIAKQAPEKPDKFGKFFSESLILAQNERWRRGLGMQVARVIVQFTIDERQTGE